MRHVVRIAAYRPAWTEAGRRVPGPDEDGFTLLATALERAVEADGADERPLTIRILGPDPSPDGGFAALLGRRVDAAAAGPKEVPFAEALARSRRGEGPEVLLATGEVPEGGAPLTPPSGSASVAVYLDELDHGHRGEEVSLEGLPPNVPPVQAVFATWTASRNARPIRGWVGDWEGSERRARPAPPSGTVDHGRDRVSEGAYLPPARYRESLPSRWGFLADRCAACGTLTFPQRGRCRACGRADGLRIERLPKHGGRIVARTWIGPGGQPTEFDPHVERQGPYGVVLVDLIPGVRATLMVTDALPESIAIGGAVTTQLRHLYALEGTARYGRKALPLAEPSVPSPSAEVPPAGL